MALPAGPLDGASLAERLAAQQSALTTSEERVAQYLVTHVDELAFETAEGIAAQTETSDATVIRTVQALGYRGMPDLKRALRAEQRRSTSPAQRLERSLEWAGEDPAVVLDHVLASDAALLTHARSTIDPERFRAAVGILADAREVVSTGFGPSGAVASHLARRLNRLGRRARACIESGFLLADGLVTLAEEDAIVLFVWGGGVSREVKVVLEHASAVDIPIVLVTDTLGPALSRSVATYVSLPAAPKDALGSQTRMLAVTEALALAVAASRHDASLAAMQLLNQLRRDIVGKSFDEPARPEWLGTPQATSTTKRPGTRRR